jgi:hypothetical protein
LFLQIELMLPRLWNSHARIHFMRNGVRQLSAAQFTK